MRSHILPATAVEASWKLSTPAKPLMPVTSQCIASHYHLIRSSAVLRAGKWKQQFITLHTYDSNTVAKLLYERVGYRELASIQPFMERRRVLFCKNL